MATNVKMVNVKLAARCLVNDQVREKDEIVDLPETTGLGEPYAECFGEIVKTPKPSTADNSSKPAADQETK